MHIQFLQRIKKNWCRYYCRAFNAGNILLVPSSIFPGNTKIGSIIPLSKGKHSKYDVLNYKPVSILNAFSKRYEKVIKNQLVSYFDKHFSPFISAYRKSYSTQQGLIRLLEEWREIRQEFYCSCSFRGPM